MDRGRPREKLTKTISKVSSEKRRHACTPKGSHGSLGYSQTLLRPLMPVLLMCVCVRSQVSLYLDICVHV